jgi:hypothetical protein
MSSGIVFRDFVEGWSLYYSSAPLAVVPFVFDPCFPNLSCTHIHVLEVNDVGILQRQVSRLFSHSYHQ